MLGPMADPNLLEPAALAPERIRPLRFAEYMRLAESGAFENEHVELLDGVVVAMSPQGTVHGNLIALLNRFLARRLPRAYMVMPQITYVLSDHSAPEPDLRVVAASSVLFADDVRRGKPLWLIEVAFTSQRKDRGIKASLYAAAGIDEYWVIDAARMITHVHRDPSGDAYRAISEHDRAATIAPAALPELALSLDDLLNDRLPL